MKNTTIWAFALALFLMPYAGSVWAQTAKAYGSVLIPNTVLLADDFESYPIASTFPAGTWVNHNSSTSVWSIVDDGGSHAARQTSAATVLISNGNTAWTDYKVSTRVKPTALGFRNGIVGRFTTSSAYYRLYLSSTASGSTKNIVLEKRVGSSNVGMQTVPLPTMAAGTYFKLTLEMVGSNIKGYVDDVQKIQVTDTDYAAGKIGFYNTGDSVYDDVLVEDFANLPPAPTGLMATGGTSQIALTWTGVSGATTYNVKRGTVNGGPYTTIATEATTAFTDITVTNGTVYYYVVSANTADGESPNSNQATATAQPAIPDAPANLTATGRSGQIGLTWSAVSGAAAYNVKKSTVDGGPYTTLTNVAAATYNDTAVTNGTPYYYVVTAVNLAGESANSNQATAIPSLAVPGIPGSVESASGNGEARLYWVASSGTVDYYNVKRSLASNGTYTTIATNVTAIDFTDTGLTNGTVYYYRISAVNAAGESVNSGPRNANPRLGQIVNVSTQAHLSTAFSTAVAGDEIILADGNYSGIKMRRRYGTAQVPIVLRSQNPLGAVFNAGQFELDRTDYVIVKGFKFTLSSGIKLRGTEYCRLTQNSFELNETGLTDLEWLNFGTGESNHNRIDHNDFKNKVTKGGFITLVGSNGQASQYDLIDHNYFFNLGPRADNDKEAIRLGDSSISRSSGFTILEHNLFEQCDGDAEIVSVKTHDNIIRYNTFRRSKGALTSRQGNRNAMYGNFFLGENVAETGGIRAYGDDHKIYNNYFEGLTASDTLPGSNYSVISLTNGDADGAELPGADQSLHYRPQRITIANNTFVGNNYNIEIGGSYTLPPRDITVANNIIVGSSGLLIRHITTPINAAYAGNIAYPTGTATIGITATDGEVRNIDPLLVTENGLQKLGIGSSAIDASPVSYPYITEDFEGQIRGTLHDVGADEFGGSTPQRLPLTSANAGLNATDHSISGHVVDQAGEPVGNVSVALSSTQTSLGGTVSFNTFTDAAGYFNITDIVHNGDYTVAFSKDALVFSPASIAVNDLSSDVYLTTITSTAPTVPFADITGSIMTENGRPVSRAAVILTNDTGDTFIAYGNTFGRFAFRGLPTGRTYQLSVHAKSFQFTPQSIMLTDNLSGMTITALPQ